MKVFHNATESELKFRLGGRGMRVAVGEEIAVPPWLVYSIESKGVRLTPGPRPAGVEVVESAVEPASVDIGGESGDPAEDAGAEVADAGHAAVEDEADVSDFTEAELEALTKPD